MYQVKQEGALGLLKDLKQEGYALTCCSYPKSDLVVRLQEEDDVSLLHTILRACEWGDFSLWTPRLTTSSGLKTPTS